MSSVFLKKITNYNMTYAEIIRLYEKKEDIIKKTNMTDEQKQEAVESLAQR